MNGVSSFPWDEGSEIALERAWLEGKTASEIAAALKSSEHPLTRSAVLGKVHRLGLSRGSASIELRLRAQAAKPPRPTPAPRPLKPAPAPRRAAPPPPLVAKPASPVVVALDTSNAKRLQDLDRRQCRFPLDDPGAGEMHRTLFCGAPSDVGDVYCQHHNRLAWCARPTEKKRAS